MNIKEYGKKYAEFVSKDIGKKKEAELMTMRTEFGKRGKQSLVIAIEKCVDYDKFGGSVLLMDFIKRTKWLLVDATEENINNWNDNNPMDLNARDNTHVLENLTIAMLTIYAYDYLDILKKEREVK